MTWVMSARHQFMGMGLLVTGQLAWLIWVTGSWASIAWSPVRGHSSVGHRSLALIYQSPVRGHGFVGGHWLVDHQFVGMALLISG